MMHPELVAADENVNHQIVSSFRSVAHTDTKWTEKIWVAAHDLDSGYQIAFGLGKYVNRAVMDGFGGIALGNDQWAVRASRELGDSPDVTATGPLRYEVLEPFERVRLALDRTDSSDFSFEVVMHMWGPAQLEDRWPSYHHDGGLLGDVLRYHQCGRAQGWLEHRGHRVTFEPERAPAFRDHSWGVRTGVGGPAAAAHPDPAPTSRYRLWAPVMLTRPDGSRYGLFLSMLREVRGDGSVVNLFDCAEELADGTRRKFMMIRPRLEFEPTTRRLLGGIIDAVDEHGRPRRITLTPARETGFHIGMGGYYGGSDGGHYIGQRHGPTWTDVVSASATDSPETVALVHQTRDVLCEVVDHEGGGRGYSTVETILTGPFPELGLA